VNDSGAVEVGLYADDASTPGDLIGILGSVSDSTLSGVPQVYDVTLTNYPLLSDDTPYWIGLSGTATVEWYYDSNSSGIGVSGESFSNQFGTMPDIDDPYQMSVTQGNSGQAATVPEPSSHLLIFPGAFFLALFRLRAREVGAQPTQPARQAPPASS
jgi:hypothetical protein